MPKGKPPKVPWSSPLHPCHRPARDPGGPPVPYQPGNLESVRHGANSQRLVDAAAQHYLVEARRMLGDDIPAWITPGMFQRSVMAWARAEARCDLVHAWIATHGELDPDGNPWPAARFLSDLEASAARRRSELGLDPTSRAKLGRDIASTEADLVDLAALWAAQAEDQPDD